MQLTQNSTTHLLRQFYELTKPRVVSLIVFCALIGMFLAVPPDGVPALPIRSEERRVGKECRL